MLFKIDPSRTQAVYAQVMNEIKRRIASGVLNVGDRLPSIRDLARTLLINPNTTAKAYQMLEAEGVVSTQRGSGTFVADVSPKLSPVARRARVNALLDDLFTEAYHLGFNRQSLMELVRERAKSFQLPTNRERGT